MQIFYNLNFNNFQSDGNESCHPFDNLSLALGFFDGIHLGHQAVIKSAVNFAKKNHTKSAVITFQDHPCCFFYNLKPQYIKASKYFLLESKQSLNILKILTQSLDIKLIATSVDEIEELNLLSEVGIHAVCGPVMKNLPEEN